MLKISDLSFQYGAKAVLRNFSWQVQPGEIHGLVGLNGAGKTTLLKVLTGELPLQAGDIQLEEAPFNKNSLCLLESEPFFYPRITGKEYLQIFQLGNPEFDISGWNQVFELPLDEWAETYSSGMKKQLALLGIVALNRPIILLDEPLRAVDVENVAKMKYLFQALRDAGRTLIITSHNLEALMGIADSISLLVNGEIVTQARKGNFRELAARIDALLTQQDQAHIRELVSGNKLL